jgi:hypothetical protein
MNAMNDTLSTLQDLGLTLPSPAYIAGLVLFGLIGMAAWIYGKRRQRPGTRWLGLALMLYPYVVPQTWLLWAVGLALSAWLVVDHRRG